MPDLRVRLPQAARALGGLDRDRRDRALVPRLGPDPGRAPRQDGEPPPAHLDASTTTRRAAGSTSSVGILVDPLSVFMCLVVSGVSTLIHLYSISYMTSDRGFNRYFSYLNFFVFSMLLLVLAGNFVLLIVGWAFVGFASYALISFWYRRDDGDQGRDEGVRHQRDRRHRPGPRHVLHLPRARHLRLPQGLQRARSSTFHTNQGVVVAICLLLWSAPSPSRRSSRSTPGSPTRWRAPRPSPR